MVGIEDHALAFDVGGTSIRASLVNTRKGIVESRVEGSTPNYLTHDISAEDIINLVVSEIGRLGVSLIGPGASPSLVSVGYPGPIDIDRVAVRSPTILGEKLDGAFDIGNRLDKLWSPTPVYLLNDLTAAGYYFVECGETDFCVVTVGSGIGNKIFLSGKPVTGSKQLGGEIGHLVIPQHADELGRLASGRAAEQLCAENGTRFPSDIAQLVRGYREQDPTCMKLVSRLAQPLAWTLACIHLACGIDRFFIIGGLAKALGDGYRSKLVEQLRSLTWDVGQDWDNLIVLGPADVDEAIVGGAFFAASRGGK